MSRRPHRRLSFDAELTSMVRELYGTETNRQSGAFVPSSEPTTSIELFGITHTATDTMSSVSVPPPPASSATTHQSHVAAAGDVDDEDLETTTNTVSEIYHPRTLGAHNIDRMSILPIFPPLPVTITGTATAASPLARSTQVSHLLLSNVPIGSLGAEQYTRIHRRAFPPLFRLEINTAASTAHTQVPPLNARDSFLLNFYEDFYMKTKKRLRVDMPVIDFNLTRLRRCITRVVAERRGEQTMLTLEELFVALEFYLQVDVDMFFLKTCSFNDVEPRCFRTHTREALFCLGTPTARFAIVPCCQRQCLCCHSPCPRRYATDAQQVSAIRFSVPHIHRFVNQYEAILNCPATCETSNCIFVLTCPCGQVDFIGQSTLPFAEALTMHREEGNRIVREFLIGARNIEYTTCGLKSELKKANDKLWLYQHSPRCSVALQLFLDCNPDYWCFVPVRRAEMQASTSTTRGYSMSRLREHDEASPAISISTSWTRTDEEVRFLMQNLPASASDFLFSGYQRKQQAEFFKWAKDRIVPATLVDLYNANIVAILPDRSSELFRQLIESLLITHAECKLNQTGHLLQARSDPNGALQNTWFLHLTRRPLLTTLY